MQPYYQDESITIYNADCRDVLPTLDKVDLVFADPPYGNSTEYGTYEDTSDALDDLIRDVFPLIFAASPLTFVTTGIGNLYRYPKPNWILAWVKPNSMSRNGLGGFNMWEPVSVYGKRVIRQDQFSIAKYPQKIRDVGDHPCPKPIELLRRLIAKGSDDGAVILDPFMGSGTTLRAAKDLNRKAIGIEIEERYCEIAAKRMSQMVMALH